MIDYGLITKSIDFYSEKGYKRIEAPWLVSEQVSDMTRPSFAAQYVVHKEHGPAVDGKRKAFVASGEQSFLYLAAKGFLPDGMYQTVTPCIRNENFDETHVKYFVKNELIVFGSSILGMKEHVDHALDDIIEDAMSFFTNIVPDPMKLRIVMIGDRNWDIEYEGIEIGSYGFRHSLLGPWVYGTGLAEPRTSRLINKYKE